MRTLTALVFIAGVGAVAIWLAGTPTVAKGRVMEAELLEQLRAQGVIGVVCDARIPIGRRGAAFQCTVTLTEGRTQLLDCTLDRDNQLRWKPASGPTRDTHDAHDAIRAWGDPWGN